MKGSITDVIMILTIVFLMSIFIYIGYYVNIEMADLDFFTNDVYGNYGINSSLRAIRALDQSMLFIAGGMIIVAAISAYFSQSHPILLIPSLVIASISFLIMAIFYNTFEQFVQTSIFQPLQAQLSGATAIMSNLPVITLLAVVVILIALYAKYGDFQDRL